MEAQYDERLVNAVTIIKDSINPDGSRITTFELELPKTLVAQFNTHSMIRRNSASSRAIPTHELIRQVAENPYIPSIVGRAGKGMAPEDYVPSTDRNVEIVMNLSLYLAIQQTILNAYNVTLSGAEERAYNIVFGTDEERQAALEELKDLDKLFAKETANRYLEPFMLTRIIATATEWGSLIQQRANLNHGAQNGIASVAHGIELALANNTPQELQWGQTHAPYSDDPQESVTSAARVSYLKRGPSTGNLYQRLLEAPHPSPFEHYCIAAQGIHRAYNGWKSLRVLLETTGDMPDYNNPAFRTKKDAQ